MLSEDGANGTFIHADNPGNGGVGGFEAHLANVTDQAQGHLPGFVNLEELIREDSLAATAVITLADDLYPNPFAMHGNTPELGFSPAVFF